MPTTYKLGDKQFQSTGDIGKDIELIKQNFPEVDTTTLQQSLSSPQSATQGSETTIKLPSDITNLKNYASQFDPTSKEYQKAMGAYEAERDDYLKLNPTAKASPIAQTDINDINTLKDALYNNSQLLEKKNSGFGGEGIDTGPIVGAKIPFSNLVSEGGISVYPAGVSEFINKLIGQGENSSDRAVLRQLEKQLFNPKKKQISGTAASDSERFTDLLPLVPNESENDQTFFKKGLQLQKASQQKLLDIIKTAEEAGHDVSGFSELRNISSDDAVNKLIENLSQNQNGSFARELPDTAKSYLGKILNNNETTRATHKFNPMTGKVEIIQ